MAVFVLIGAALVATVWSTRSSVNGARAAVGKGEALQVDGLLRYDLSLVPSPPSDGDLADILADHADEGLRYIAALEGNRVIASAGKAIRDAEDADQLGRGKPREIDGRYRFELRTARRIRKGMGKPGRFVVEVEPVQAEELREDASRTLWIGVIAAISLLGVAAFVIRRESRRQAEDRKREQERRLQSLGEMSAVLAHEIKNPLASLKGNAQLLASMLPDGEKPKAKAQRVVDEAVRLEKLTQDLLAFVRTGTIQRVPTDPVALATERAGEGVTIDAAGAPAKWSLDPARIREVLINLVENALAAGDPVVVRVRRAGKALVYEVEDRGPGVPEDERAKIFEAFVTNKTHGTGLGLAVVRRVVELHGGTVTVLAGAGTGEQPGAIFRVEIPEG